MLVGIGAQIIGMIIGVFLRKFSGQRVFFKIFVLKIPPPQTATPFDSKAEVSPRMMLRHCEQKTQEKGEIRDKLSRLLRGNPSLKPCLLRAP